MNTGLCGTTTHLVTYNLLLTYTNDFTRIGSTHNRRLIDQYGADPEELLPFHIFKEAVYFVWVNVLEINKKSSFVGSNCGPKQANLCMDGVAVGMLFEKVKDIEMDDFIIPFESPEVLDAPAFKDRMFIKTKKNRDFLKRF